MYQIFISYRREGGEFLGKMIYDRLSQKGYRVFYDVETLTSGHFNTQLYHVIEECQDFLLLLTPGSMDRCCRDSDDWVRSEIRHALKCGKNIIPIMARGFSWPPVLPEELRSLPIYEAVTANNEYFDALSTVCVQNFSKVYLTAHRTEPGYRANIRQPVLLLSPRPYGNFWITK